MYWSSVFLIRYFRRTRGFTSPLVQFDRLIACGRILNEIKTQEREALNMSTAKQIIEMLGLKPHPTCGFVAETYRSKQQIPQQVLQGTYEGSRPFGSVLYFMVTPEVCRSACIASAPTRCTTTTLAILWRCCCYTQAGAVRSELSARTLPLGCVRSCSSPAVRFTSRVCARGAVLRCSRPQSGRVLNLRTSNWAIGRN
jgi:Cupin superfamily (DUF985)